MNIYEVVTLPDTTTPPPVRLLRLLPAQTLDDHVKCELFLSSLETEQIFEALSCTWGSTDHPATMTLQDKSRQFTESRGVTQNLATALKYLRLLDRDRVLWVDAL